jgi:hypothetical protein
MYCVEIIVVSCDTHDLRVIQTIYVLSDVISSFYPPRIVDLPCPLPAHPRIQPIPAYPTYVRVFSRIIVRIQVPLLMSLLSHIILLHDHP